MGTPLQAHARKSVAGRLAYLLFVPSNYPPNILTALIKSKNKWTSVVDRLTHGLKPVGFRLAYGKGRVPNRPIRAMTKHTVKPIVSPRVHSSEVFPQQERILSIKDSLLFWFITFSIMIRRDCRPSLWGVYHVNFTKGQSAPQEL